MLEPTPPKPPKEKRIVIEGITESGEKFRPSDWVERMCGCLANYKNRRITYSPKLQPSVDNVSKAKCLVLDPSLRETNPDVFDCIMKFADENRLKIHESYEETE